MKSAEKLLKALRGGRIHRSRRHGRPFPNRSLVPRFNILLLIAVPRALAPVVTAPKKPPPTFLNLSLALVAVLLLYATPNAPTPYKPVTADAV